MFCEIRYTVRMMKRQATDQERHFVKHISGKELYPKYTFKTVKTSEPTYLTFQHFNYMKLCLHFKSLKSKCGTVKIFIFIIYLFFK